MIIPDASRLNSFICDSFSLYVKTHISDKLRFSFELDIFSYFLYHYRNVWDYDLSNVFQRNYKKYFILCRKILPTLSTCNRILTRVNIIKVQSTLPPLRSSLPDILIAPLFIKLNLRFKPNLPIKVWLSWQIHPLLFCRKS